VASRAALSTRHGTWLGVGIDRYARYGASRIEGQSLSKGRPYQRATPIELCKGKPYIKGQALSNAMGQRADPIGPTRTSASLYPNLPDEMRSRQGKVKGRGGVRGRGTGEWGREGVERVGRVYIGERSSGEVYVRQQ